MAQNFSSTNLSDALISSLDIAKPQIYNKLVGRYPKQRDLDWLKDMGKLTPVYAQDFYHHEEEEIIPVQLIASAANGTGSAVLVTLDSTVHVNSGVNSYPRVGNLVQFNDLSTGLVTAKDTSVASAHVLTVKPVNASQNVQSGAVAGQSFICYSSAFEDGTSGFTTSVIPGTNKVTSTLQTFGEFFEVTGQAEEDETWIEYTNPSTGETKNRYYIKGEADTADRFKMQESLGLFITPKAASLTNAAGDAVTTTKALIPTLVESGNLLDYTTAPTMQTYDSIVKILNGVYADSEYLMCEGINFSIANKNFHSDFAKDGAIEYNSFGGENGKKKALDLGFNSITMNGFTFHIKKMNILSHASTTAANGMPYPDYAIMIPMGAGLDPKSAEMVDYFGVRYKPTKGAGARGDIKIWETGGNSKAGTSEATKRRVNYHSIKGLQVFGAKRYILLRKK